MYFKLHMVVPCMKMNIVIAVRNSNSSRSVKVKSKNDWGVYNRYMGVTINKQLSFWEVLYNQTNVGRNDRDNVCFLTVYCHTSFQRHTFLLILTMSKQMGPELGSQVGVQHHL